MDNTLEVLKSEARSWKGVTVEYRDSWSCDYFIVSDKGFCMLGRNNENELVMTVKGNPVINEKLRNQYSFIVPGYYSNKKHWISVKLEESTLTDEQLVNLLKESYQLVLDKLPKKVQMELV